MKKIALILLTSLCFLSPAHAASKKSAPKTLVGTITRFECGDNCYLTITDSKGQEHTGLCHDDTVCEKLMMASDEKLGSYKGKKVKVSVGIGNQVDGSGTVMDTMDAFTKIQLLK
jgi:hypothetical protein